MKNTFFYLCLITTLMLLSCKNDEVAPDQIVDRIIEEPTFGENYEAFIAEIDMNEKLQRLNSLSYADPKNNAVQVFVFVNDSSVMQKIEEKYTTELSNSINTNLFYYKNGKKHASIQCFEEKDKSDSLYFVEIRSFYDTSENVIFSKKRTAEYEEFLIDEPFVEISKSNCSEKRAMKVLNQEGEYQTTFQGFVRGEEAILIVVGEPKKDGYSSALAVQHFSSTINYLMKHEKEMLGTPLEISFYSDNGDQLLQSVKLLQ